MKGHGAGLRLWLPLLLVACCVRADVPETLLEVGDRMPEWTGLVWLQGADPLEADPDEQPRLLVVDCWATWCGSCQANIPHLNALSERYAEQGVAFIGVVIWDTHERASRFVGKDENSHAYPVAFDGEEVVAERLMKAFGRTGIPCAFLVDVEEGIVLWIGHPAAIETPLEQVLAGEYDLESVRRSMVLERAIAAAVQERDWDMMDDLIERWMQVDARKAVFFALWMGIQREKEEAVARALHELIAADYFEADPAESMGLLMLARERFPISDQMREKVVQAAADLAAAHREHLRVQAIHWHVLTATGAYDEAVAVADDLLRLAADDAEQLAAYAEMWMQEEDVRYFDRVQQAVAQGMERDPDRPALLGLLMRLKAMEGDVEQVEHLGERLLEEASHHASLLNDTAWMLMTDERIASDDFMAITMRLAERAETVTMGENPAILDTLALAHFRLGNIRQAINIEKAAIALAPDFEFFHEQLEKFKRALEVEEDRAPDE